ncbi:hypothetical protein B0J17DRAFT_139870 [Rhizoctonia solani]|nr:hypothetical protein B0J17DRAFT_139870 [Rhizoctonia solani]
MRERYNKSARSIPSNTFVFKMLFKRTCGISTTLAANISAVLGIDASYILQYEAISNTISLLSKTMSMLSYHRWTKETKEEVRLRQKFGQSLNVYFEKLESAYQKSLEGVKNQRIKEIKRRLRALGWLESDFDFASPQSKEWDLLINKPTPLTDQEWSGLHLKLGPLLFSNRSRVQLAQREKNLARQNTLLSEFLTSLKVDILWHPLLPFFRGFGITHQPRAVTDFLDSYPFPSSELAKTWSFFFSVGNLEVSEKELRVRFADDRERVKAHINSWRVDIEITLANRLMEERGVLTMAEAEPLCRVEVSSDMLCRLILTRCFRLTDLIGTRRPSRSMPNYYCVPTRYSPMDPPSANRFTTLNSSPPNHNSYRDTPARSSLWTSIIGPQNQSR